jgi:hypothetical protein
MRPVRFTAAVGAVFAAGMVGCAPHARRSTGTRGEQTMTQATSRSIVLRSTHIVLTKVVVSKPGTWAPSPPGLKSRKVELSIRIAETLRGKLDPAPEGPVEVTVEQTEYAGMLMMQPLRGSWSRVPIDPGTELVTFSESGSQRAEQVLEEPGCKLVLPAEQALPGARIAAQALRDDLLLARTLELAAPLTEKLDPVFAGFLWERYADEAMASQRAFDALAEFSERKGLGLRTRQELIEGLDTLVSMRGDETPRRAQRLALTMFRVLLMPEAAALHENLIGTDLPNLLGISSGLPPQPASRVFEDQEPLRAAAEAFLRQHGTDADATPLLEWIKIR